MSLMGSLYIGSSGLQTSQNALHTVAHNMSNIDTTGYTRQQVQQGTRSYITISTTAAISHTQSGLGVNYSNVKQVRDYFLDRTYRREAGRGGYYDASVAAVEEVEDLFQELEGEAFAEAIDNLWGSIQELTKDPGNSVNQGVLVQRCSEFITRADAVYQGLCEYQDNLNLKIENQVDTMNKYANRIAELNQEILKIEAGKIESANDLKDERNQLIDELAKMGKIDVREDVEGNVLLQLEGQDFVSIDSYNPIGLNYDPLTGFATPYWAHLAKTTTVNGVESIDTSQAEVFDLSQDISTDINTDIGSLKAILLARGDGRGTYADLQVDTETYQTGIKKSIIMNVQAEFDQLVNKITSAINNTLAEAANTEKNRNPDSTYLWDESKNAPYTIFDTKTGSTDLTIENIIINGTIKQSPSLLGFKKDDGKIDQETADKLKQLFTEETHTLNPEVKTATNFVNYYNNLISQVANTGSVLRGISENQQVTVDNTVAAREQIVGVSSDEELSNMIMFQNAYNASSRYINVINELLDHVVSTLGR